MPSDSRSPVAKDAPDVVRNEKASSQRAKGAKRYLKLHAVGDQSPASQRLKSMAMVPRFERSKHLFVDKSQRRRPLTDQAFPAQGYAVQT